MEQRTLNIDGMSCGHCVARVKKALETVAGITVEDVQVGSAKVQAQDAAAVAAAIRAVDDAGYPAREA